jgi:hypothetical protein
MNSKKLHADYYLVITFRKDFRHDSPPLLKRRCYVSAWKDIFAGYTELRGMWASRRQLDNPDQQEHDSDGSSKSANRCLTTELRSSAKFRLSFRFHDDTRKTDLLHGRYLLCIRVQSSVFVF